MYSLEVLEKEYDMNSPEGKTEFMKETARRLTQFEEEIERNNYIEAVAKAYHVGFEDLRKLVGKKEKQEVRISEKLLLSINEANALSGIG